MKKKKKKKKKSYKTYRLEILGKGPFPAVN